MLFVIKLRQGHGLTKELDNLKHNQKISIGAHIILFCGITNIFMDSNIPKSSDSQSSTVFSYKLSLNLSLN